ncbi:hypothetical protein PV433_21145 [Paenibacillus sp. GYB004]|uniref:hypothetical protein n=1 Tax=Paenibacillus sp. GYB004 TaxID=2994393 RepID=UPI002F9661D2
MQALKKAQIPDELEMQLIKEYIVLPHVLNVFERDMKKMETEQIFKTYKPYVAKFNLVIGEIVRDLTKIRIEMRKRGIKVYDGDRSEKEVIHEYLCRGYMGKVAFLWGTLRSDVEIKMNHYLGIYESELVKEGVL